MGKRIGPPHPLRLVEVAVLIAACAAGVFVIRACARLVESPKVEELRRLAAELPTFPDFKEVDSGSRTQLNRASITKDYSSSASPDEVEKFYAEALSRRGFWYAGGDNGGRSTDFRKGEFLVEMTEGEVNGPGGGRIYKIDFFWRAKGY